MIVFAFYLPFSIWTAPGKSLEILTIGAEKLAALIELPEMIPANLMVIAFKIAFGIVLAIIGWIIAKLISVGLCKLVELVDDSPILWRIDGVVGAIVFILLAVIAVCFVMAFVYVLEYLNVWEASKLFAKDSPLMGNAYEVLDVLLKPELDKLLVK